MLKEGQPPERVANLRHFCKTCGCHLWAWAPLYPTWVYPLASAIDTPLPDPPERCGCGARRLAAADHGGRPILGLRCPANPDMLPYVEQ